MFHIKVEVRVNHDDRDKEFILLKREIIKWLKAVYSKDGDVCEFGAMSCESIARVIRIQFEAEMVEVSEDGENGAIIRKTKKSKE
jgi:hypothetical protein